MSKAILCPTCGAPQPGSPPPSACPFCGCGIDAPVQPRVTPSAFDLRPVLLWACIAGALVLGGGLVGALQLSASTRTRGAEHVGVPAVVAAHKTISLTRLRDIPLQMSLDVAKTSIESTFPEAQGDIHHKQFAFDISNPLFNRATASWEWGCNCLEGIVISFDWNVWQKARDPFVMCLVRALGEPTKKAPPAVFEWAGVSSVPALEIGWQAISIRPHKSSKQADYQREIDAMVRCTAQ